jgi:hypothetical protein
VKLEIWRPGDVGPSYSTDDPGSTLQIISGSVTYDKSQEQRSQLQVQLVDPTGLMIPQTNEDLLTPWGNEIRAYRGIQYPDGTRDYVLLGVFRISQNQIAEAQGVPTMSITAYDRSWSISRNVNLYQWPGTSSEQMAAYGGVSGLSNQEALKYSYANLIQVICSQFWPRVQFTGTAAEWTNLQNDPPFINSDGTVDGGVITSALQGFSPGTDMYAQARQYAQACGCDLFMTRDGVLEFYRDPSFNAMSAYVTPIPVWSFVEGETAMFDQVTRTLSDSVAYNAVLVTGAGSSNAEPLTSTTGPLDAGNQGPDSSYPTAWPVIDNDPESPTYYGPVQTKANSVLTSGAASAFVPPNPPVGTYGSVPQVITNNLLVSQVQVNDFARLQLVTNLGSMTGCTIPSLAVVPNIEVDDIVAVQRNRIGLPLELFIVQQHVVPLTPTQQGSLTLRQKRNLR